MKTNFRIDTEVSFFDGDVLLNYGKNTTLNWNLIDRTNYSDFFHPKTPSVTEYTNFSLQVYFIAFICLTCLQTLLIYLAKSKLSKKFEEIGFLRCLSHSMLNTQIAFPTEDWDFEKIAGPEMAKKKMKQTEKEVLCVIGINFIFNSLLTTPVYILCKKPDFTSHLYSIFDIQLV